MMNASVSIASDFDHELERQLATGEFVFPTFPDVVFRIRSALMDQRCSTDRLSKIVASEPVLSAHVLKVANSVAFNPGGRQIAELPLAVMRLGFFMVRNIAYAVGYKQLILRHLDGEALADLRTLWRKALEVGCAAYVVGLRAEANPHEAFLAGLMHNVGDSYIRFAAGQKPDLYRDRAKLEELMAAWRGRMAEAILKSWGLAEQTRHAVAEQGNPGSPLGHILQASLTLSSTAQDAEVVTRLRQCFLHLGIPEGDAAYLRRQAADELESLLAALG
jgi:HD-like signal output (HDOD) protein